MATERFKVQPDEQVLMKGPLSFRKGKWSGVSCQGTLTNKRLALGKKLNPMWSIIPRLFVLIMGRKIVFQIPLENFHSIRHNKEELGLYFIIRTMDGTEYPVNSEAIFGKKNEDWISAIADAVSSAVPGLTVHKEPTSVEFVRA